MSALDCYNVLRTYQDWFRLLDVADAPLCPAWVAVDVAAEVVEVVAVVGAAPAGAVVVVCCGAWLFVPAAHVFVYHWEMSGRSEP